MKKKFIKKRAIKTTKNNYNKVEQIVTMNPERLDGIVIKFYFHDTTFKVVKCNKKFFYDSNNKRLNSKQVLNNIYAMKHDYNAKYFKII